MSLESQDNVAGKFSNEIDAVEIRVPANFSNVQDNKMEITVVVNSINGTIQAGLCTIDVTRVMKQSNIPLKKCSDKSASICITSSFEFLQVAQ